MHGFAASGGQAKILIRSGVIQLNGTIETRNKKKLYNGNIVEYQGKKYVVKIWEGNRHSSKFNRYTKLTLRARIKYWLIILKWQNRHN